jgi:hypothetical protein
LVSTKHKLRSKPTLSRPKTGARRQARLVRPWLELANAAKDPSANLIALTRKCLNAQEITDLKVLPREQVIEKIQELADLVHQFFNVLLDVADDMNLAQTLTAREGVEIEAKLNFIHFAIGPCGRIITRRIDLDRFFIQILPELAPENVRICTRERCRRLFYAARKDQFCCTPRCAQLQRQGEYNQRRK